MLPVQNRYPNRPRKFLLGLGVCALALTGYLALRPAKKISPLTEETPTSLADASRADAARAIDALKRLASAPRLRPAAADTQTKPAAPPKIANLQELFAQMKDAPVPVLPVARMDITLKKFICPDDLGFDGDVGVYDRGNLVGYVNIGRNFDDNGFTSDWLNYSLYRAIVDERGEKAGYQQVQPYMSPNADLLSLGGKFAPAHVSQGADDYIYAPDALLPFAHYDKSTDRLTDLDGQPRGSLGRDERYLELMSTPSCIDESFQGAGFIEFPSAREFDDFKRRMGQDPVWKEK